jgi:hypothetical protein
MQVFDTTLCVICSHLAADQNNTKGRNAGFHALTEQLQFTKTKVPPLPAAARPSLRSAIASQSISSSSLPTSPTGASTAAATTSSSNDAKGQSFTLQASDIGGSGAFLSASTESPLELNASSSSSIPRSISFSTPSSPHTQPSTTSTSGVTATSILTVPVEFPELACFSGRPAPLSPSQPLPVAPPATASSSAVGSSVEALTNLAEASSSAAAIATHVATPGAYCTSSYLSARSQSRAANLNPLEKIDVWDHEHIIWIGDLNYRLDIKDHSYVFSKIDEKDFATLVNHDQVTFWNAKCCCFTQHSG